ncbi:MAG TPA: mechanosensitive ion channel domain-containing protein [Gemmatimonadales bacterium]|nr:mechanosensitive ion channel domain-containing protein [Gemmatimonadales bacterium]
MSAPPGFATPSLAALSRVGLRLPRYEVDLDLVLRGAVKAAVIVAIAYLARWTLRRFARRIAARVEGGDPATVSARAQRAATLAGLFTHVGNIVIVVVAGLLFLNIFIDIGPLLAGAGVLGVAISLGGQAVMKDLITGFMIVLEDQYAVGDRVRIGDIVGTVHQLTLRTTVLRDEAGAQHYLANGSITVVANLSRTQPPAGGVGPAGT